MNPPSARETIDLMLQLPAACAGADAAMIEAEIDLLDAVNITFEEFGELAAEADTALSTVRAALGVLLVAAWRKEGRA